MTVNYDGNMSRLSPFNPRLDLGDLFWRQDVWPRLHYDRLPPVTMVIASG